MKALWLSEPGKMELVERPMPAVGANDTLIKVAAAAICHTDFKSMAGRNANVRMPLVLGHELSGTVEACGDSVRFIKPGDRVAIPGILACFQCRNCWKGLTTLCLNYSELGARVDGGFAEYVSVPARVLIPLEDGFPLQDAALAEAAANGFSAARQAAIQTNDDVVVIGPGAIGLLALQFARLYNPRTLTLIGTRDARLFVGNQLGATHTINVRTEDPVEAVMEITNGKGADAVVQCGGTLDAMRVGTDVAGEGARVCIEATLGTDEDFSVRADDLNNRALTIVGVRGWNQWDFVRALECMQAGLIDVRPLITHTFPLSEFETAFDVAENRKDEALRVLLLP